MSKVEMKEVKSSNVKSVGYDNGKLYVEYNNGTYEYNNVPKCVFESLLNANSVGRFVNEEVKPYFDYNKVVL